MDNEVGYRSVVLQNKITYMFKFFLSINLEDIFKKIVLNFIFIIFATGID